ncbi:MAG: hypothetical protein A3E88_07160 [Legionellales bacterium RIFCSPHIGHO2_12_FULL_35_11]|nr:MAG: hypothetical protein A3E88_07160 [Legionellales bacterium RIFCSPHIGHO2_12_FULL_35_11]
MESLEQIQLSIERIVCSGGGAKGVRYAAALLAMINTGMFKGVKEFSGSSAGAITAMFMAIGISPQTFREQLLTTNLKDLMGKSVGKVFGKNPVGTAFLSKDGKPLEEFLRDNVLNTVRASLEGIRDRGNALEDYALKKLLIKLNQEENVKITFADLALLNHYFPNDFKKLIIPAVRRKDGAVQIFNAELTPDVEIALACRASASIPVILKPVAIEINGVTEEFVDGGLYDNLPTDYFDTNEKGEFIINQKPTQTMVFAFGEGLDDKKNQVSQALYGSRWDEVISSELIDDLLNFVLQLNKSEPNAPRQTEQSMLHAIELRLRSLENEKKITSGELSVIMDTIKPEIQKLLSKRSIQDIETQHGLLIDAVKHKLTPILYKAGFFERLKRNFFVEKLGDVRAPYKNTEQKEVGYQKLRTQYALRTVELRVGKIKTTDFDEATRLARIMDSLGYLDTVNHITNHELHDSKVFNAEKFYIELVNKFESIYEATLFGCGKEPHKDSLIKEIKQLRTTLLSGREHISTADLNRQIYQLIKDRVESNLDSEAAFALSRTVEFHNKLINSETLFKEIYEFGFKHGNRFAVFNIAGEKILKSTTLHETMRYKNMFALYAELPSRNDNLLVDRIFASLSQLPDFFHDAATEIANEKLSKK